MNRIYLPSIYILLFLSVIAAVQTAVTMGFFTPWAEPEGTFWLSFISFLGYIGFALIFLFAILQERQVLGFGANNTRIIKCFIILAGLEIVAFLPCLLAVDALCGVFLVLIHQLAGPAAIIGLFILLAKMSPAKIRNAIIALLLLLIAFFVLQHEIRRPGNAEDCSRLTEDLGRSNCIKQFALASNSPELCMRISFDFVRFSCLYQVAGHLHDASLCDRIKNLPGDKVAGRPSDAAKYKETCLKVVGRAKGG